MRFQKGHIPWNKGLKGMHYSPATEFKKGHVSLNWVPVGTIKKRRHKRDGLRRWVKIAEPNVWNKLARFRWENEYGTIKKGDKICHLNRYSLDDRIENLIALPPSAYVRFTAHKQPLSGAQVRFYIKKYQKQQI